MKRFLCILLAAALLLGCCGALAEDGFRYEGDGFDTPEEAALWYLAGLKNGDYDQMLSAFAWETQADHYDFKKQITRTKGITPVTVPGMPASNGLLRTAALEQIRDYQIHMICVSLENYINDEMYASLTSSLLFNTDEEPDEYFRRCDNGRIEKLAEMT